MFRDAERRFLFAVVAGFCVALTGALLFFAVKYAKENIYAPQSEEYYSVVYTDSVESNETVAAGAALTLPALTKTGYTFGGWYLDEALNIKVESGTVATSNLTLYPDWQVNRYLVTAHNNFDGGIDTQMLSYESTFSISVEPRTGYDFDGWYFEEECETLVYHNNMPAEDLEIYAKWKIKKYILRYQVEELPSIPEASVEYGTLIDLPVREKAGYTFVGWFKDSALTIPFPAGSTMPAEVTRLYPKFAINAYTITFMDTDLETELCSSITRDHGTDLSHLYAEGDYHPSITPEKEGNEFLYWHLDGVDEPFVFSTMPIDGLVLYAAWLHI